MRLSSSANTFFLIALCAGVLTACGDGDNMENGPPATPITAVLPELREVEHIERSVGRLQADVAPIIAAETSGRIIEVYVESGDQVTQGQVLARLDGEFQQAGLDAAMGDVSQLTALYEHQVKQVARIERLVNDSLVADSVYEAAVAEKDALASQLATAKARLSSAALEFDRVAISAPIAGEIDQRHLSVGDFVSPGQMAFSMVAPNVMRAVLPIPERLTSVVRKGQTVRLSASTDPLVVVEATISEISPAVGQRSRAVEVAARITNPGHWRNGQSIVGDIVIERSEAVVVPAVAVVKRPGGDVVYVVDEAQNTVSERPVSVGVRHLDGWAIEQGLSGSEMVAHDGAGFLTDGARISMTTDQTAQRERP